MNGDLFWCFDDDYKHNDDDDLLMMMNSCMQNGDDFDGECMYWIMLMLKLMLTNCLLNVSIIESYVHALISRIFISNEDD